MAQPGVTLLDDWGGSAAENRTRRKRAEDDPRDA